MIRAGSDGILSCDFALQWMDQPSGYQVEEMKFINSKYSDYSPVYARSDYQELYFTSSRDETTGNAEHGGTGQQFSDIFFSTMDKKGKWSTPLPLPAPINTEAEEGTPVFSSDYNTMYFTRCNISKRKALGCEIFTARRDRAKNGPMLNHSAWPETAWSLHILPFQKTSLPFTLFPIWKEA